jgi:hypothetical protein
MEITLSDIQAQQAAAASMTADMWAEIDARDAARDAEERAYLSGRSTTRRPRVATPQEIAELMAGGAR